MHHDFLNELPHDFQRQFLNLRVPLYHLEKEVCIQHSLFLRVDFLFQHFTADCQLLFFFLVTARQRLKLSFRKVRQRKLFKGGAEQLF